MYQQHFYHETFKTAIKIFGKLFSNITVKRDANKIIEVPISYSQKDKVLQKYYTWLSGSIVDQTNIILPRMGFVMGDPQVDKTKQLNRLHKIYSHSNINKTPSSYNSIPFTVPFPLSIMTKSLDDMFQIVEQIIPFFYPEFSITIQDNILLNLNTDFVYKIDSITTEQDSWDGTFDDRRLIVWTISFTCDLNIYHPVTESHLIKKMVLDGFSDNDFEKRLFRETLEVVPLTANASDTFEIMTTSDTL